MATVRVAWEMPIGSAGKDDSAQSPFPRAVRNLMSTGAPIERLGKAFVAHGHLDPRWLGVFVTTAAGRLVYFPGIAERGERLETRCGFGVQANQSFELDHLTLEPDSVSWHATSTDGSHLGGPRTMDLGDGQRLWFGMSIRSPELLVPVRATTEIEFDVPDEDAQRRLAVLHEARRNVAFPLIALPTASHVPGFWHFGVVVGPQGQADYVGGELGYPYDGPYCSESPGRIQTTTSQFRLSLSEHREIIIIAAHPPGTLKVPVCFSSPQARQLHGAS